MVVNSERTQNELNGAPSSRVESELQQISNNDDVSSVDNAEELSYATMKMGPKDIWALGITVVIGGQYFSWNAGLKSGFGSYFLALLLTASMYLCLVLCNAELSSAFPFTGGSYGLCRLTIGLYGGFVVACCEAAEYIFYVASSAISLSRMLVRVSKSPEEYCLVYALVFYVVALTIHIRGGHVFRYANNFLSAVSLLVILMYFFGSLQFVNFAEYAPAEGTTGADSRGYFIGGVTSFMNIFPLAAWFYVGVESLNLASAFVPNAREDIPKGAIACMLTLMVTSILVLFACSSIPLVETDDDNQGSIASSDALSPLNDGFILMFKMSSRFATALSIPATFATAYGFIFAYGRLILSMARSSLFPKMFTLTCGPYSTPFVCLISGSFIGYCLCIMEHFFPKARQYVFNLYMLSGYCGYTCQFCGYLLFIRDHDLQERSFRSPLGTYGAIYGMIVALIGIVSMVGFQNDNAISFVILVGLVFLYSIYYFGYAKSRQKFSDEEKNLYFKCHVRGYNRRIHSSVHKGDIVRNRYLSRNSSSTNASRPHRINLSSNLNSPLRSQINSQRPNAVDNPEPRNKSSYSQLRRGSDGNIRAGAVMDSAGQMYELPNIPEGKSESSNQLMSSVGVVAACDEREAPEQLDIGIPGDCLLDHIVDRDARELSCPTTHPQSSVATGAADTRNVPEICEQRSLNEDVDLDESTKPSLECVPQECVNPNDSSVPREYSHVGNVKDNTATGF